MLLVYALAAPPRAMRGRGIAGEPLRAVTIARLTAIVGEMTRTPAPTTANAIRYDALLRRLASVSPALLPARFATAVADEAELRFILTSRGASLRAALRHVRHRVQMTVRLIGAPGDAAASAATVRAQRTPQTTGGASGAAYLRHRAAVAAAQRDIPGFDPLRAAVRRWVRDERVERRDTVATVYHLVPRASSAAYLRAIRAAVADAPLRVIASGPFPPYAFASW